MVRHGHEAGVTSRCLVPAAISTVKNVVLILVLSGAGLPLLKIAINTTLQLIFEVAMLGISYI